jgi:hypothetical protein
VLADPNPQRFDRLAGQGARCPFGEVRRQLPAQYFLKGDTKHEPE